MIKPIDYYKLTNACLVGQCLESCRTIAIKPQKTEDTLTEQTWEGDFEEIFIHIVLEGMHFQKNRLL